MGDFGEYRYVVWFLFVVAAISLVMGLIGIVGMLVSG